MVYEHDYDKEIEESKVQSMDEINFLFEYEIMSSWWTGYIPFDWMQEIVAAHFSRKVVRKWKKYRFTKMLQDVKKEEKS